MWKIVIAIVGVIVIGILLSIGYVVSTGNEANEMENSVVAEYDDMRSILATYSSKVAEVAQVPSIQTADLEKVFSNALEARYGANGSTATMQWIQEQNPNLDQSTYKQIMQVIEAGRNEFKNAQTKFIDTKRIYSTNLGYMVKGTVLRVLGYPKIDLKKDFAIISTEHADTAFKTKLDTPIKLR